MLIFLPANQSLSCLASLDVLCSVSHLYCKHRFPRFPGFGYHSNARSHWSISSFSQPSPIPSCHPLSPLRLHTSLSLFLLTLSQAEVWHLTRLSHPFSSCSEKCVPPAPSCLGHTIIASSQQALLRCTSSCVPGLSQTHLIMTGYLTSLMLS